MQEKILVKTLVVSIVFRNDHTSVCRFLLLKMKIDGKHSNNKKIGKVIDHD